MAKKDTFQSLMSEIADGKVISSGRLRNIFNKSEKNALKFRLEHINAILKYLDETSVEKIGLRTVTKASKAKLITDLTAAKEAGPDKTGDFSIAIGKYTTLSEKYIALLNKADSGNPIKWELGHETGVASRVIQFLNELYDLDSGNDPELVAKNRKYIEQAVIAAGYLDSIDDQLIREFNAAGKEAAGFGATENDLATILDLSNSPYIELKAEKKTGAVIKAGNQKFTDLARMTIKLRPESEELNQTTGALSRELLNSLRKALSGDPTKFEKVFKNFQLDKMTGSPSPEQIVSNALDVAFDEKKKGYRATKSKVSLKRNIRSKSNNTLKQLVRKRTALLKTKLRARKLKKKFIIPTVTLKAIINESLAEFIKNRMGNASDPAVRLRYQTGRFSESAILLSLNRTEAGALIGTYDFMKDPYGTFLPGGRLHTQQRDPKVYIEGAIRDIAIQVLKNQFNGIVLELN